jgi:hypothetical protein
VQWRVFRLGAVLVAALVLFVIVAGIALPFVAWYFGG